MKQIRLSFSFFVLLLAFSHSIATDVGNGLKPFHSTTPVTKSRIAFLVGINSYKATTSLKYAVGDSEAIEDLLLRTGKYDKLIKLNDYGKITTTLNPETQVYSSQRIKMAPTKVNIEATYQEILAANPDTLLFYYSGHGFIEGEGGENFIAPKDVDVKFEKRKVGQVEKEIPIPLNGISLKVMGIQAAKVKRVVFLIDACRSPLPEADGESAEKGEKALSTNSKIENEKEESSNIKEILLRQNLLSAKTDKLPKRVLEAEGITMLIGAAPEVSSLEDEDFKSGIFTHFLKKAFNGGVQEENQEEYITEENLSRYIEDRFKQYYELRRKESELAAEPKLYNLAFDRGKKGEILISQHRPIEGKERIDKPIYTDKIRKRDVKGKLVYNEKGEREDLRFFVHDKKRDVYYPDSLDGVYKMEYSFNKDKSGELEKFTATEFNLENEEVFEYGTKLTPNVGWEYKGLYNASDTATDQTVDHQKDDHRKDVYRKDLINQVPTIDTVPTVDPVSTMSSQSTMLTSADTEKIRFEKKIYDFNGNIISEEYFDANGKPLEFGGVAKIVRAYDKYGQVVLEEFYSKDTLDEYGDVIEKGKLIARGGFARYKAKYKSKGNLLFETWEDVEGKIVTNKFGYAKTKYIYDKFDKLIRKKFYNSENKLVYDKSGVSVYSYSYNSDCIKFYESKIAAITKKGSQTALTDWKLGKYKLCLAEEIHTNKEGNPANDENQIYRKIRSYDQKGNLVSEESFRPDCRRHLENGVAKVEYTHDQEGNIISRKNFGEFEVNKKPVPVSDSNGVHEYRFTYQEYFNYDGRPILNECMYHRKEKGILIEPYGCVLKIEHFGINGKPIEDKGGVYRTNLYYSGAYQIEADRQYYSLDGKKIWASKGIFYSLNPFGSQAIYSNFTRSENKNILEWQNEYKYDEKNNLIISLDYKLMEGKGIYGWRKEKKYDSRNNIILEVQYKLLYGEEILRSKFEFQYDSRSNMTMQRGVAIVEGKEVLFMEEENFFDDKNNKILYRKYESAIENRDKEKKVKIEYKFDDRNNKIAELFYETKDGIENITGIREYKFDERNNVILISSFHTIDGKKILNSKTEYKYDDRNNKILEAKYKIIEQVEILEDKIVWEFDERNNKIQETTYEIKEGKEVLKRRNEYKFNNRNLLTQRIGYESLNGKVVPIGMNEIFFDDRGNSIVSKHYRLQTGEKVLQWKTESKYDERNNMTSLASYQILDQKEILRGNTEWKFDEYNNNIFFLDSFGAEIQGKKHLDYRAEFYRKVVTKYEPQIKEIEEKLKQTKDESEKKSLNQKLEDLQKEFQAKKKKYTLTEEKFGKNEKLESASYKLLFFNPRGPAEKRLMRVDLDQFYRPVKVGFEEE